MFLKPCSFYSFVTYVYLTGTCNSIASVSDITGTAIRPLGVSAMPINMTVVQIERTFVDICSVRGAQLELQ